MSGVFVFDGGGVEVNKFQNVFQLRLLETSSQFTHTLCIFTAQIGELVELVECENANQWLVVFIDFILIEMNVNRRT